MEKYYRNNTTPTKSICLQALSWKPVDEEINDELVYNIYLFGITSEQKSISVLISGFTPYFYVKIPDELQGKWRDFQTNELKNHLIRKLYRNKDGLLKITVVEKKNIYGFTNETKYQFLKLIFKNEETMKKTKYMLAPSYGRPKPNIPSITRKDLDFELFEANIDPYIRLCHQKDIKLSGWINIDKYVNEENEYSRCQIDISTKWNNLEPSNRKDISNIRIASFDIECISYQAKITHKNIFPNHQKENDKITQIGITFYDYATKQRVEYIATNKANNDIKMHSDKFIIDEYDNEKEVILGWINTMKKMDPDIVMGYNSNNFDWKYIYERCKFLNIELYLFKISRLHDYPSKWIADQKLSSSARGENVFNYLDSSGIINTDLMTVIKQNYKLPGYKLNEVAQEFIGDQKEDLSPADLFQMADGTDKEILEVLTYCVKDCTLLIDILLKKCIISNTIAMSCVCHVPYDFIEYKGQQVKVHSQLLYESRLNDYLVPTIPYKEASADDEEEKFTGATVLEPTPGAYFEPVSGLDFASLYPSIMIANNYSYETMVKNKDFDNIEGVEYKDIVWKEDEGKENERTECVRFVQNKKGILPTMLEKLWMERKSIKKEMKKAKANMKEATDPEIIKQYENEYEVLDGFQLAMKVSMNSIYGFTGANFGRLPEKRIAAATTAEGRRMIRQCKDYLLENFDCEVVYGDSVADYTPVFIMHNSELKIIQIKDLEKLTMNVWKLIDDSDKECIDVSNENIFTWSDNGWTHLKSIIRHKLHESKNMIRVLTHTGLVDVTDDHSLLREDKTEVSPKNVNIGDTLLHYKNPINSNSYNSVFTKKITWEEAKVMGFFFGDGSCGYYNCNSGNKASWALNNKDIQLLEKYKTLCECAYPEFSWVIYNTVKSSNVYKLSLNENENKNKVNFIKNYRNLFYNFDKNKIIPDCIINNEPEIREAFLEGLYDADGDKDTNGYVRIDQKSQISACQIKWLFESLGYNTSINTRKDKLNIYRITASFNKNRKKTSEIKKLDKIEYDGYVYDLTTSNHHFAAGIGNMIVHNTDSVYVKFKTEHDPQSRKHMVDIFAISERAGEELSNLFRKPIEMEFEKVMYPFIIFSKKRYACVIYTNIDYYDYIDYKGIQVVRRDNCPFVKEKSIEIFKLLLLEKDIDKAVQLARKYIQDLLNGNVPIKDLVISKALKGWGSYEFDKQFICNTCGKRWYINVEEDKKIKKKYSVNYWDNYNPKKTLKDNLDLFKTMNHYCFECKAETAFDNNIANIPHVALARKMEKRDQYNCPQVGERVPYVFKKTSSKRDTQFQKVEDPKYLVQNKIEIDYEYYWEHQFKSAVETIFEPILKENLRDRLYGGIIEEAPKKKSKKN